MAAKKSDGFGAVYTGDPYKSETLLNGKYPQIEPGDKGIVIMRHKWDIEKDPTKSFAFYPNKWGNIFFFPVSPSQIKARL